jgi:putative ABC transport system ATP-binding protein
MTTALELRQVSKVYGSGASELHALSEVDLSVERGELVAVMGPSGSGKSTLLTIAGSLEEPTSGEVLVDGTDLATVSRTDRAKLRRRSIGYVFQDFNLLPGLKAIENVTLPLELDGLSSKNARSAARRAMAELDVADRRDHFPDELSGGERQRVAIARTILKRPPILLFDEATSALDTRTEKSIQESLRTISQGVTTLIIAHRLSTVVDADEIVVLEGGQVAERGRHAELLARGGVYAAMWARQVESSDGVPAK